MKEMAAFTKYDFWHPMDTLRDKNFLEKKWQNKKLLGKTGSKLKKKFWKNKKVLVIGHTGFKGGWLTIILSLFEQKSMELH